MTKFICPGPYRPAIARVRVRVRDMVRVRDRDMVRVRVRVRHPMADLRYGGPEWPRPGRAGPVFRHDRSCSIVNCSVSKFCKLLSY